VASVGHGKALVRRLYDEGINRRDAAAAAAFPDFHYRIEEATAEDDRIVCKVTMTGTHLGQPTLPEIFNGMLRGVAPTGKRITVLNYHSFRIKDGLISEHAAVRDDLGMVLQLGLVKRPS